MKLALAVIASLAVLTACAGHSQPKTALVNVRPFTASGSLKDGYTLGKPEKLEPPVDVAREPSPYGSRPNTYFISDGAENAAACWGSPHDAKTVLCTVNPWSHKLRVLVVKKRLATPAPKRPQPYGIELADGARCIARVGGTAGSSKNGWTPAYYCDHNYGGQTVLFKWPNPHVIDRIDGRWYVHVGEIQGMNKPLHPKRVFVKAVLFVG